MKDHAYLDQIQEKERNIGWATIKPVSVGKLLRYKRETFHVVLLLVNNELWGVSPFTLGDLMILL